MNFQKYKPFAMQIKSLFYLLINQFYLIASMSFYFEYCMFYVLT